MRIAAAALGLVCVFFALVGVDREDAGWGTFQVKAFFTVLALLFFGAAFS